jgi:adenine-specific DNA-methyltransferase
MPENLTIKTEALEPLFAAWEEPDKHHWQDYRTRKDRTLKTVSDFGYDRYPKPGKYTACVKVVDVFGCDTSITVEVKV